MISINTDIKIMFSFVFSHIQVTFSHFYVVVDVDLH